MNYFYAHRAVKMCMRAVFLLLAMFCIYLPANARTVISGIVTDSVSGEPLKFVNVKLNGSKAGGITDSKGRFSFVTDAAAKMVTVSSMGYTEKSVSVKNGVRNNLNIKLVPTEYALEEVIIKPKKEKYSKKNNPAVDLIERVRSVYSDHDPRNQPQYSYNKYDKLVLALNEFQVPEEPKSWFDRKFEFMREYVDTNDITGQTVLNLSVREKVASDLFRGNSGSRKQIVEGLRSVGIDEAFNRENIQSFTEDVFREVNIFGNDITILQNRFVSPLSAIATNYYKFYTGDTIVIDGRKCAEIRFTPHNKESFGFTGRMYVDYADSALTVRRLSMHAPRHINLNYLKDLYIFQEFQQDSLGNRHKTRDDMSAIFQIVGGTPSLYGRRSTVYDSFDYAIPPEYEIYLSEEGRTRELSDAQRRNDDWWESHRKFPLKPGESRMGSMLANLRSVPLFYWGEKILSILVKGYVPTGNPSKVDLGPVNTLVSANSVEGARFRIGGMTTANMSKHWFARAYLAYGTKDRKFKYNAELEYSFLEKVYHSREFPIHSIRLEHNYDLDQLGQHYLFTNADNIFLSLKRQKSDKVTYRRLTQLTYTLERRSGLSFEASLRHEVQEATRWMPFEDGYGNCLKRYGQGALRVQLRYAPGETFYQSASQRLPINMDNPVLILSHEFGPKGWLGNRFTLNKTMISFQKRFWMSAFGYLDLMVKGEKIWNQVDYPSLCWSNANLSYTIQPESFALMNPMEFPLDQSASWFVTYWANGVLFNRIPGFSRLKLREVVSFRGVWGSLTDKNNPDKHPELFQIPFDAFPSKMTGTPYMELSAGIDNILTFLRVDYVWRLSYRNTPNTDKGGVRVSLHFSF